MLRMLRWVNVGRHKGPTHPPSCPRLCPSTLEWRKCYFHSCLGGIVTGHVVIENYKEGEQHVPCVGKEGTSQLWLPLAPWQCCLHTTQGRWHALIFLFPKSCMISAVSFWPVIHLDLILCIRREVRMLLGWFVRPFSRGSTLTFPCFTELQLAINTSVWTLFCPIGLPPCHPGSGHSIVVVIGKCNSSDFIFFW